MTKKLIIKSSPSREGLKWSTLQAILQATNELLQYNDLDTICRRTVELARERLGIERCSLFLLDADTRIIHGTYGTDMQGQTRREYHLQWDYDQQKFGLSTEEDVLWHINYDEKTDPQDDQPTRKWVAYTWMKQREDLVALFCNDTAITESPVDESTQQSIAVYCSMVYGIIRRIQSEAARLKSQLLFEAIFNASSDAIFLHEKGTGKILLVNEKACEMFGYTVEEILQRKVGDLSEGKPPYSQSDALACIDKAADGDYQIFEWLARQRSGSLFWVEVSMRRAIIGNEERVLVGIREINERKRSQQIRDAMYQIAATSVTAESLEAFYPQIHEIIGQLMPAKNFFIALYDAVNDLLDFPYHVDQYDPKPEPHHPQTGLTGHVLRSGQPLLLKAEEHLRIKTKNNLDTIGTPAVDWLGVPLIANQGILGVMAIQTYAKDERITDADREVLIFVSNQVAMTIQRKRAEKHQQKLTQGLHAVIAATDELLQIETLDDLYRSVVELGRKRIGLERCSLYLLDENQEYLLGTYGTDAEGNTSDEHTARLPTSKLPEVFTPREQMYKVVPSSEERPRSYWQGAEHIHLQPGWVTGTPIHSAVRPLGVLYNDTAISNAPFDPALQETTAVYCSMLGNIIDRKRLEEFEKRSVQRLNGIVKITDELIACTETDTFYRKAVELAREKLDIERCAIFLFDPVTNSMHGTYGTDFQGATTDEHGSSWLVSSNEDDELQRGTWFIRDLPWTITEQPYSYQKGAEKVTSGLGWAAHTSISFGNQRLGTLINDAAISGAPPDGMLQETIRIYCSLLGSLIQRLQSESERQSLIGELSAKNAELERFTYTVSHDLKAPLITIRGFLGFLEKDATSGNVNRLNQDINRITRATSKMEQLLDDLLQLSRVGRIIAPPQNVPFTEIVNEALDLLRGTLSQKQVGVKVGANMPIVYGDRVRLIEVIQNLVENAVKFMGEQPAPHIEIGFRQPENDQPGIFYVQDNGIGIEPQYHERIFGLFDKLDAQSEGTGIGLALVRRIIEMHGGKIWVESKGKGQGTTFCFHLGPA